MPAGHDHGDAGEPSDCDGAQAACCTAAASVVDARLQLKKDPAGGDFDLAPVPAGFELAVRQAGPPDRPPEPLVAPPGPRRLYLLNCVFRD